ncbi:MAG: ABC transporter ATP-binding protein [Acidobacteriota bacterium]
MRHQRLVEVVRPYRMLLLGALFAAMLESVVSLMAPWPLKWIVDNVLADHAVPHWLERWAGTEKIEILRFAALAALAIATIGAACSYAEKHLTTTVGQWVTHDLRKMLYFHMQRLGLTYHDHNQTGDLVSRVTSDIDSVQSFITSGMLTTIIQTISLVGMVGVMFYMNWRFTLIALSIAPVLFFVVFRYTRMIKQFSRDVRKKEGQVISLVEEMLTSIRVVKAFAREDYEQKRLEEESLETVEAALKARGAKARLTPLVEIIVAIGTSMVLWFGGRMALQGALTAGALIVFVSYLSKLYKPMQELSKMTDTYTKAVVGYERIVEVLDAKNDVQDAPGARNAPAFRGEIEFRDVTFGYEDDRRILDRLSLKIQPGQTAALVGPTGSGKSTIIGLLSRFYDPESGTVLIDGRDIRSYRQKSLREQISIVLQETLLFHEPLWKNIAYGKPNATRAEIMRASERANADEFVEKLPQGYDTMVGERGVTLSGGQRQRIAIARAIIRDTPILLLDEPSSGLDAVSEKLVFEALDRMIEGKTSIIVAHRLSTIRRADVIFVIRDGQVVETGNHTDLVQAGGFYAEMCQLQFGAEEVTLQANQEGLQSAR